MSKTLYSLLPALLFPLFLSAQDTLLLSSPLEVYSSPLSITAPRLNFLGDGTALFTWGLSGSPRQILCSRFENDTFSTPVSVVQGSLPPDLFGFGGFDVAVNGNQVFVVYERLSLGIMLARSDDGGLSFSPPVVVQSPVSGGYATLASLVLDGTGNPVVSYIVEKNGAVFQVRRSSDGGQTFGDPVIANSAAPGGQVCECCLADFVASGDSIWMIYRNNNQNLRDIWVARSTDLAATFDVATDVDATDWMLSFCPVAGPRITRAGNTLITAWMSGASGQERVYLSTLTADKMETGIQLEFPPEVQQNKQSFADLAASGDTTLMVFLEGTKEIVLHYSTNGPAELPMHQIRLTESDHTLQLPSIAVYDGMIHLVYVDPVSDKIQYRTGIITQLSATNELYDVGRLTVVPNPTTGVATLQGIHEPVTSVQILNINGSLIRSESLERQHENGDVWVDMSGFCSGIYLIKVVTEGGLYTTKLFKM
ncbi:MAG: T9SS type A sorting domain-containing protein [Lewinellaceae bacterium]|nr:T9SS type A sorting domain-containing protein [Saprospiraceae bacterium]MCB9342867.1 T9SS type A sorting domain-containing protein [Lewinellaceae bacterium]